MKRINKAIFVIVIFSLQVAAQTMVYSCDMTTYL